MNLGGFAGVSVRYPNAKLSLGYRADFFFGAMDGGVDAANRTTMGFFGPFATIDIGLGADKELGVGINGDGDEPSLSSFLLPGARPLRSSSLRHGLTPRNIATNVVEMYARYKLLLTRFTRDFVRSWSF